MFTLYSFLYSVAFLILSPRFLFDALRNGKYAAGFWQRMGYLPEFDGENKPVIWLHCVSVGETQAARPLVDELIGKYPDHKLVVSTITKTGQDIATKLFAGKAALVFYFPFDFKFAVRRALKKIDPKVVLLMETELWFNFLRTAHKSGVGIAIVNGRLSERSVNRYLYIKTFMQRVLKYVDLALMQNQADAGRIKELGMKNSRIRVTGNIKFDLKIDENESALTEELRKNFKVTEQYPFIVAASTHAPEEKWILEAFTKIRNTTGRNHVRLILAPRHPERFDEVANLLKDRDGFVFKRSDKNNLPWILPPDKGRLVPATVYSPEIILLDSIGELRAVYPLAMVVFVGGSLIPHGGQNILEPAAAQKAIVTGPHTMNFAPIVKEFVEKDAIIQIPEVAESEIVAELTKALKQVLDWEDKRIALEKNAFALIQQNRGASAKTVEYLKPLL